MTRSVIEALPKTYHHPMRPAAPRGMGWVNIGSRLSRKPTRASSQPPTDLSQRLIVGPFRRRSRGLFQGILQRRVVRRLDLQLPVTDPPDAVEETARRRPRRAFAR